MCRTTTNQATQANRRIGNTIWCGCMEVKLQVACVVLIYILDIFRASWQWTIRYIRFLRFDFAHMRSVFQSWQMIHKPCTPHNEVNFTRTGKRLFHEYTKPLCVVMPKLLHSYRAEGFLSICLGIMPPCSFFCGVQSTGAGVIWALSSFFSVSFSPRFWPTQPGYYNGSFAATLSLGLSHFSSAEEDSPFNFISFC